MTVQEAKIWVAMVRAAAKESDDEKAHALEDDLREKCLRAIAEGAEDPKALARVALSTKVIDFQRHCS